MIFEECSTFNIKVLRDVSLIDSNIGGTMLSYLITRTITHLQLKVQRRNTDLKPLVMVLHQSLE